MPLNTTFIAVALIGLVALFGTLFALVRFGVIGDRGEDTTATDRIQRQVDREDQSGYSIAFPLRARFNRYTLPAKIAGLAANLLVIGAGVYLYFTFKGGAPIELPYVWALEGGAIAVTAAIIGLAAARRQDRFRGEIEVIYEDEDGGIDSTEIVYYDTRTVKKDSEGRPIVAESYETRFLGLFGKRRLAGDVRSLRGKTPFPGEPVTHQIPKEAAEVGPDEWVVRTRGRRANTNQQGVIDPDAEAHYSYRTPITVPYEVHLDREERMSKMEQYAESLDAQLGEAQMEISRLRRKVNLSDDDQIERLAEKIATLQESLPQMYPQQSYTVQQSGAQRHPTSQSEVAEMDRQRAAPSDD
ncbi:hypothetical protein [Halomarina oriensis]|uniref:Uncharacterized protein n=1 Tax=Halomarina oriensis TaxID=671145 RepID=A0A6B0GNH0_9EURY|nr:hypothetical protein [Halomarina oriensis]MWG36230.1 hypothetical protein [Halomarina oriensis]